MSLMKHVTVRFRYAVFVENVTYCIWDNCISFVHSCVKLLLLFFLQISSVHDLYSSLTDTSLSHVYYSSHSYHIGALDK